MENHGLGTHNDKIFDNMWFNRKYVSQIPPNFFGPSTQIGQLYGIFLKNALITYPLSMLKYLSSQRRFLAASTYYLQVYICGYAPETP